MLLKIIVLLFIINATFKVATTKPIEENESLIDKLQYKNENGTWTCYDVKCPVETFGCKIWLRTAEEDRKVLYQSFNCLGKDKQISLGAADIIQLSEPKTIDMALEIYINAQSVYTTRYSV